MFILRQLQTGLLKARIRNLERKIDAEQTTLNGYESTLNDYQERLGQPEPMGWFPMNDTAYDGPPSHEDIERSIAGYTAMIETTKERKCLLEQELHFYEEQLHQLKKKYAKHKGTA